MIPVFQTRLEPPGGNCWAACVASVLELPLKDVPSVQFREVDEGLDTADIRRFWSVWNKWLAERNLGHLCVALTPGVPFPRGYVIIAGRSPRGCWTHSVLYLNGKLCHDPHPAGGGIVAAYYGGVLIKERAADMLYPLNPAQYVGIAAEHSAPSAEPPRRPKGGVTLESSAENLMPSVRGDSQLD